MSEKAKAESITPQKVKDGLSFRLTIDQAKDYLNGFSLLGQARKFWLDWEAFREGLNNWEFWEPPKVNMLVDDGLGMKGSCRACGFPHIQIYPQGGRPMKCPEALKVDLK